MISRKCMLRWPIHTAEFGPVAGAILDLLRFEYEPNAQGKSRLRIFRHERWWVAKTHHELESFTGCTSRQLQWAINKLVASGRVEVRVMLFNGAPTRHFHVPEFVNLCPRRPEGGGVNLQENQQVTDSYVKSITVKHLGNTEKSKSLAGKPAIHTSQSASPEQPGEQAVQSIAGPPSGWLYQLPPIPYESMTVPNLDHILAAKKAKKAKTEALPASNTAKGLEMLWHKRMATEYGGFQKPFTGQQYGQLKKIISHLGLESGKVVDHVLQHWADFTYAAKMKAGKQMAPAQPDVGYLLLHLEAAVQLIAKAEQPAKAPTVAVKPKAKPVKVPVKQPETPATPEEVQAMIDDLKGW